MAVLRYAGIGARATPAAVLANMTVMAGWLARAGWTLSTGGADGADSAFAAGAPAEQRTVWLPWQGYNGHRGPDCRVLSQAALAACMEIAAPLHPAWERCSPAVRKLHARNVAILLGERLDRPVDAVVCWSERGAAVGGSGHGHPHRAVPRHPGVQSRSDGAAGGLRAVAGYPPGWRGFRE